MKNFVKTRIVSLFEAMRNIAIIAVVAMIGFSMTACGDEGGGGDNYAYLELTNNSGYTVRKITVYCGNGLIEEQSFQFDVDEYIKKGDTVTVPVNLKNKSYVVSENEGTDGIYIRCHFSSLSWEYVGTMNDCTIQFVKDKTTEASIDTTLTAELNFTYIYITNNPTL